MRFLKRLWSMVGEHVQGGLGGELDSTALSADAAQLRRKTYETLQRADDDFGRRVQFNTVVSAVMELCNAISKFAPGDDNERAVVTEALKTALVVISPIAPHISHELWQAMGESDALITQRWPDVDESALVQSVISMVVQVNGKVRGSIEVGADADKDAILQAAKAEDNVARHIADKTIRKEIVVPDKLVNIVVG